MTFQNKSPLNNIDKEFDYTIIIPAFNEERRISQTLMDISNFIDKYRKKIEIIIVNDGSQDNTSYIASTFKKNIRNLKIVDLYKNTGKGFAVKKGVENSSGKYLLIVDADGATPIKELLNFENYQRDYDLVIGSRKLPDSLIRSKSSYQRRFVGYAGSLFTKLLIKDIKDTQCGFKLIRKDVADNIFSKQKIKKFGFDIEILVIAKLYEYNIKEVAIEWTDKKGSKIHIVRDSFGTFIEVIKIYCNLISRKY